MGWSRGVLKGAWPSVWPILAQALITLIFVAAFGGWINAQFNERTEKTSRLISALGPQLKQKRSAYLEFRLAAINAHKVLDEYFPDGRQDRWSELQSLESDLGIDSDVESTPEPTTEDAMLALRTLITLRENQEYVAGKPIKTAEDRLIDTLFRELRNNAKNRDDSLGNALLQDRLDKAFKTLDKTLVDALGLNRLPME